MLANEFDSFIVIPSPTGDEDAGSEDAIARFTKLLTFKTVSNPEAAHHVGEPAEFDGLHKFLQESFPLIWKHLKAERVGQVASAKQLLVIR